MSAPGADHPWQQVLWLFVLAIPTASVTWTVTHEEIFREPRDYCIDRSKSCSFYLLRKFFYLFTCEYCFSHYVAAAVVALTGFRLLLDDWRGYVLGGLALVWVANLYMNLHARLRIDIKSERASADARQKQAELLHVELQERSGEVMGDAQSGDDSATSDSKAGRAA